MTSRRAILAGAAGAVLTGTAVACAPAATPTDSPTPSDGPTDSGNSGANQFDVASVSEIAVGSAKMFEVDGVQVLITHPRDGVFRAFSAICTHSGCVITGTQNNDAFCGCHASAFDTDTGAVKSGPARNALPKFQVEVSGDRLIVSL